MAIIISPLSGAHDRNSFSCQVEPLDRYLREQAGQDVRRRIAQCYVAHEPEKSRVAGYYTLSAGQIALSDMPADVTKKLPRYPVVPVARVGRLAIDVEFRGRRLGSALLWDAIERSMRAEPGIFALAVDAKDDNAAAFYQHLGFVPLPLRPGELFLPVATFTKV